MDCIKLVELRPNDFDIDKILNNSVYLQLFEMGRWDWVYKNSFDMDYTNLSFVLSDLTLHYLKPIPWALNKTVEIKTSLTKLGSYSAYFHQEIIDNNIFCVKAKIRVGFFNKNTKTLHKLSLLEIKDGMDEDKEKYITEYHW